MNPKRDFNIDVAITTEYLNMMQAPQDRYRRGDSSPQYKALNKLSDEYGYTIDTLRGIITNTKRKLRELGGGYENKVL